MINKNKFITLIGDIALLWWSFWSNIRFHKAIRKNIPITDEEKVSTVKDIQSLVSKLYKKFHYTPDGPDQLWDAITPPPQNYQHYLNGELKDDCDGFHSLVYHCLYNNDIECYLLTVNPFKLTGGHCILIFKLNNKWHINDYIKVYSGFDTPEEAIVEYNKTYPTRYGTKEVAYNGLIRYDFKKGKFHKTTIRKITK